MIELHFLIPAVISEIFNPTVQLAIPKGTPTNKANAGIKIQPQIAEMKIRIYISYIHIVYNRVRQ